MLEVQIERINITTDQVCKYISVKSLNQILHFISVCEGNVPMLLLYIPQVRLMER